MVNQTVGKAITALKPQARRDDRVNVYLDGEFGLGLQRELAAELRVGQQLSEDEIARLQAADQRAAAYRRAVQRIARRPRSERELAIGMQRQGLDAPDVELVIDRLREAGLADDLAFANAWIENRMAFRPRGALALRSELRGKGVEREVIEQALEGFSDAEAARRAADAGARKYQQLSPEKFRRRLSAYLSRRGFERHTISPLVHELAAEVGEESEEPN